MRKSIALAVLAVVGATYPVSPAAARSSSTGSHVSISNHVTYSFKNTTTYKSSVTIKLSPAPAVKAPAAPKIGKATPQAGTMSKSGGSAGAMHNGKGGGSGRGGSGKGDGNWTGGPFVSFNGDENARLECDESETVGAVVDGVIVRVCPERPAKAVSVEPVATKPSANEIPLGWKFIPFECEPHCRVRR